MSGPFDILVVDDDHLELVLIADALRAAGFHSYKLAARVQEALDLLAAPGARRPALVLCDMKIPGGTGIDLLRHLRAAPALADIPVVIFTASEAERDVSASYAERANAYVIKPFNALEFRRAIADTAAFWLGRNLRPPSQAGASLNGQAISGCESE